MSGPVRHCEWCGTQPRPATGRQEDDHERWCPHFRPSEKKIALKTRRTFTPLEMSQAAARELAYRKRVYPRLVAATKMEIRHAREQLAVMEAIRFFCLEAAARDSLDLFGPKAPPPKADMRATLRSVKPALRVLRDILENAKLTLGAAKAREMLEWIHETLDDEKYLNPKEEKPE